MNRVCSYTCAMLMAGIQLPAIASFFDSSDFEHLDDDLLFLISFYTIKIEHGKLSFSWIKINFL